ncbi:hypothetical protein P43SY_004697 [Pythium insidiosum]|uniref:Uncharacterized protein n=1 Tax=Pythium insidiosum TaxID=114742 RepID=A0AAD5LZY6_PYTIN|nr:hypothetical protein P43SY_004697 [Pythium insidiosum]
MTRAPSPTTKTTPAPTKSKQSAADAISTHTFVVTVAVPFTVYGMVFDLTKIDIVVAVHAVIAIYHTSALAKMTLASSMTGYLVFSWPSSTPGGVLGLESKHFNAIFAVREVIETLLQTLQAYRLSQFVARRGINSFFVTLLVINCWITPLIQQRFANSIAVQRLLCLAADITLDFASSVLISSALLVPYVDQFDWRVGDFPMSKWYDLRWLITAMNEFQLIHVTTWSDLFMRLLFSGSMIMSMNKVKYLLRRPWASPPDDGHQAKTVAKDIVKPKSHPNATAKVAVATNADPNDSPVGPPATEPITSSVDQFPHRPHRAVSLVLLVFDVALVSWGFIVLVAFVVAGRQPDVRECAMQTRPWFTARPACALLVVSCAADDSSPAMSQRRQELVLDQVQPSTVMSLVLRDCPALHVSPQLATLQRLVGLKIANSSIVSWTGDAVLRDALHPHLLFVFMERVSFPDGLLPDGLLAADFPRRLLDIEVCVSNLRALPDDLHEKWGAGGIVFLERSALTHVPPVLLKMEIAGLSLHGNAITEIPSDLIAHPTIGLLRLVDNPIKALPPLVDASTFVMQRLCVDDSKLSGPLPAWASADVGDRVVARRTPLCAEAADWRLDSSLICTAPEFITCPAYPLEELDGSI